MTDTTDAGNTRPTFGDVPEFDSVSDAVAALRRVYVETDAVDHAFDVSGAFVTGGARPADGASAGQVRRRAARLEGLVPDVTARAENAGLDLSLDRLGALVRAVGDAGDSRGARWYCRFAEHALALAAVLADARLVYPGLDAGAATAAWNRAVGTLAGDGSRGAAAGSLRSAANETYRVALAVRRAHELWSAVERRRFADPDDTLERVRRRLREAVEAADPEVVADLADRLGPVLSGEWTAEHCLQFDPYEFEHLCADLWAERENHTEVTQASQDKGIDVIVRRPDDRTLLIQAKRYRPGNTVGIVEVQRTAGLLVEFPAAKVLLVTSSSFTSSARDSGASMDRVALVDGDRLTDLLTASSLSPPLLPE